MHALKPNTDYRIMNILVAIPASVDLDEVHDGLNEMIRAACSDDFIADWSFVLPKTPVTTNAPVRSSPDPQEGELFW